MRHGTMEMKLLIFLHCGVKNIEEGVGGGGCHLISEGHSICMAEAVKICDELLIIHEYKTNEEFPLQDILFSRSKL